MVAAIGARPMMVERVPQDVVDVVKGSREAPMGRMSGATVALTGARHPLSLLCRIEAAFSPCHASRHLQVLGNVLRRAADRAGESKLCQIVGEYAVDVVELGGRQ